MAGIFRQPPGRTLLQGGPIHGKAASEGMTGPAHQFRRLASNPPPHPAGLSALQNTVAAHLHGGFCNQLQSSRIHSVSQGGERGRMMSFSHLHPNPPRPLRNKRHSRAGAAEALGFLRTWGRGHRFSSSS